MLGFLVSEHFYLCQTIVHLSFKQIKQNSRQIKSNQLNLLWRYVIGAPQRLRDVRHWRN